MISLIEIQQPNTHPAPREQKQKQIFPKSFLSLYNNIIYFHLSDCSELYIWRSLALVCLPDKVLSHCAILKERKD